MDTIDSRIAAAAIDCARCRSLLEKYAGPTVTLYAANRVDAGTSVAYAAARHFGRDLSSACETCPDCGRSIEMREHRNTVVALMLLDRAVP